MSTPSLPTAPRVVGYEARLFGGLPIFSTRLVREYEISYDHRHHVRCPADAAELLGRYFLDRDREELVALLLDTGKSVIGLAQISVGGRSVSILEPAQLFKAAILANADSVVVAHNHPSGNLEPSREDVVVTRTLVKAGKLLGLPVQDHLIVTLDGFTSLADRGLLS